MMSYKIQDPIFDKNNIIQETRLTLILKQDNKGISNYSFNLNDMGENENISNNELSQKRNKLFRATSLIRTCLELANKQKECLANG